MKKTRIMSLLLAILLAVPVIGSMDYLESLQPEQEINGFIVKNLYVTGADKAMGARFISKEYGFIVDLLRIQSVPQAFFWVKTPPSSSMGEPHTCEHLLLGKGNRGRYVSTLESMSLGSSTAYTSQVQTCYHFNAKAGPESFYEIFEAKLMAFLHPDFTDEEIRREVCHIGINEDPATGKLSLDEKGTVYTEMVSYYEKPWKYYWDPMTRMVYGEGHEINNSSGGEPSAIRKMVPADMWKFIADHYHLANMGAIISIPDKMPVENFLERLTGILKRCQPEATHSDYVGIGKYPTGEIRPASEGTMELVQYPSESNEDKGRLYYAWPAWLELDAFNKNMADLFMSVFGDGTTSNLYKLFVNSETRKIDIGANSVWSWLAEYPGSPLFLGIEGIDNVHVTEKMLDSVRTMILAEMKRIHDFADNSPELAEFNKEVKSYVVQWRKQAEDNLNSPPMFGFRSGPAGSWMAIMQALEKESGFRKSLVWKQHCDYADSLLATGKNFWRGFIDQWKFLTVKPYAVGASPSSTLLAASAEEKQKRLDGYLADFKKKYGVADEQAAIAAYKAEFDSMTAELEKIAANQKLPGFTDNPPLTLDDNLDYQVLELTGKVPMVASTFENMNSATLGLALRLDVVPENNVFYLSALPGLLTSVGVIENGKPVKYEEMQDRLRNEVISFGAGFDQNAMTGRYELTMTGKGGSPDEIKNVLRWMQTTLDSPYWSVENLPRIYDYLDQSINGNRNRTKSYEEYWVDEISLAYRYQTHPVMLATGNFLTMAFNIQRLRCLLTDPGDDKQKHEWNNFMEALAEYGKAGNRESMIAALNGLVDGNAAPGDPALAPLFAILSDKTKENVVYAAKTIRTCLADIPDANLVADWAFLCKTIKDDVLVPPQQALDDIKGIVALIKHADNARMYMVSNSTDRKAALDGINKFLAGFSKQPSARQTYAGKLWIVDRLKSRQPEAEKPCYAGLVFDGTNNGVLMASAKYAGLYEAGDDAILDRLAGALFTGGAGHSLFMRTWGAGLAYSNGFGIGANGRMSYYAERCPDIAETMRFVVGVIKENAADSTLRDYCIAQVFQSSRAASKYESRGSQMAADLADGITPERIRTYNKKVLELRRRADLFKQIKARQEKVYGRLLVGYGQSLKDMDDGTIFVIGPEAQFVSFEEYIKSVEGERPVYRLYPRDFWQTM
mgnify:CR=1 FL=1